MHYLTFTLTEKSTNLIKCIGVKYKKTPFALKDIEKIQRNGTSNKVVKVWIKEQKIKNEIPDINILYQGEDSAEACWNKQQVLINHKNDNIDLIGIKISNKRYTKKLRSNEHMRRPIIDQRGIKYSGVLAAGEELLLAPSNISKVLYNKLDHIGGYKFKFEEDL